MKYKPTKLPPEDNAIIAKLCFGFSAIHTSEEDDNPLPEKMLEHYGSIIAKLVEYDLITPTFDIE